ncbi:hypothetical protein IJI91_03810 [Candidatus Saccharibacteria bacterium]|nr:hypothetical protein [Candidatus Saccharibacteria bacterium]
MSKERLNFNESEDTTSQENPWKSLENFDPNEESAELEQGKEKIEQRIFDKIRKNEKVKKVFAVVLAASIAYGALTIGDNISEKKAAEQEKYKIERLHELQDEYGLTNDDLKKAVEFYEFSLHSGPDSSVSSEENKEYDREKELAGRHGNVTVLKELKDDGTAIYEHYSNPIADIKADDETKKEILEGALDVYGQQLDDTPPEPSQYSDGGHVSDGSERLPDKEYHQQYVEKTSDPAEE